MHTMGIADMIDNPPTSSQPSQHAMGTFQKAAQAADEVLRGFISSKMSERSKGRCAALGPAEALQAVPLHADRLDVELRRERFAVLDACDARDCGRRSDASARRRRLIRSSRRGSSSLPRKPCFEDGRSHWRCVGVARRSAANLPVLTVAVGGHPVACARGRHLLAWQTSSKEIGPLGSSAWCTTSDQRPRRQMGARAIRPAVGPAVGGAARQSGHRRSRGAGRRLPMSAGAPCPAS